MKSGKLSLACAVLLGVSPLVFAQDVVGEPVARCDLGAGCTRPIHEPVVREQSVREPIVRDPIVRPSAGRVLPERVVPERPQRPDLARPQPPRPLPPPRPTR